MKFPMNSTRLKQLLHGNLILTHYSWHHLNILQLTADFSGYTDRGYNKFQNVSLFFMTQILNTGSQNIINTITKITNKYNSEQNIHVL